MDSAALGTPTEYIGYAASGLVLATFCFSNPVWLRLFALMSNVAFIAFGYMGAVHPVLLLHLVLLPINAYHLSRLLHPGPEERKPSQPRDASVRLGVARR